MKTELVEGEDLEDSSDDVGADGCAGAEDGCCTPPHELITAFVACIGTVPGRKRKGKEMGKSTYRHSPSSSQTFCHAH